MSDNQIYAKAQMVYLIREARHMDLALGLDSIRFYAIDIDVRSLADYVVLKSQGVQGLSKDLKWLNKYVYPPLMRSMKPQRFIILTNRGSIGYGVFPYPEWHKKEKENILSNVGVKVEYGEQLKEAILKGTYKTVSDKEHAVIIRMYIEEVTGIMGIASKLGRSSRTPSVHINSHNAAVKRSGFCVVCKRVGSQYFNVEAVKALKHGS